MTSRKNVKSRRVAGRPKLGRRALLRGMGTVAVGLPFLDAMSSRAGAAPGDPPRRLITFFSPNGFDPVGRPTSMDLTGTTLEALTPHSSDLIIARGFDMVSASFDENPSDGSHYQGWSHALVGDDVYPHPTDRAGRTGGAISYDMEAASRIGGGTRFRSSLQSIDNENYALSWHGPAMAAQPEARPRAVFDRLFAGAMAAPDDMARVREQRRSVLDFTRASAERLRCRLGVEDRTRLDAHFEAIRDVERRLEVAGPSGASCGVPAMPGTGMDYPTTGRAQMDLLVMSLACDLTRVGSVQFSRAVGGGTPTWLGLTDTHHDLSHQTTAGSDEAIRAIDRWYAEQFAYLLAALKAVPEGDGTLLDHTAILWLSEGSDGGHGRENVEIVVAGGAGGRLRTGQFLEMGGTPHNNLLLELINSVLPDSEEPLTTFGNPLACTGGVPEIRV